MTPSAHVAADGATLLTARIRGEVQPEVLVGCGDRAREIEIEHSWFDPGASIDRVDRQDAIHADDTDDEGIVEGGRSPGQTGTGAADHEGVPMIATRRDDGLNLAGVVGKAHDRGRARHRRGVVGVEGRLHVTGSDPFGADLAAQTIDE